MGKKVADTQDDLDVMARGIMRMVEMIDEGGLDYLKAQADELPPGAREPFRAWLALALEIAGLPVNAPSIAKRPPPYRKGTGRKVVSWADCPWQPPQ